MTHRNYMYKAGKRRQEYLQAMTHHEVARQKMAPDMYDGRFLVRAFELKNQMTVRI